MAEKKASGRKSVEACGITVEIDASVFNDARFMLAISKVSDDRVSDDKKLVWYSRALDLLFDEDAYGVMCDLADANGGQVGIDKFNEFFQQVMEAVGGKN